MNADRKQSLGLLTGLSLVVSATGANAAVISETEGFNASTSLGNQIDTTTGNGPELYADSDFDTVQFDRFDASLGTLTGVTYELFARVEESFMVIDVTPNAAVGGAEGDAETTVSWSVTDAGGQQLAMTPQVYNTGCFDPMNACTNNTSVQMNLTESAAVAGPLGMYVGIGSFSVDITNDLALSVNLLEGDLAEATAVALGFGALTITYTYDEVAVPEPATGSLIALALATFAALRRRIKSRRVHG